MYRYHLSILIIAAIYLLNIGIAKAQSPAASDTLSIQLDSATISLPEFYVKGEKRIAQVKDGRLSFNVPMLLKQSGTASNAFEALGRIPGISIVSDKISLVGASTFSILFNGYKSPIPYEQMIATLKAMPVNRLSRVEIMYSAPASTGVRGAAINLIIDEIKSDEELTQALIKPSYGLNSDHSYALTGDLYIDRSKWHFNAGGGYGLARSETENQLDYWHSLGEQTKHIAMLGQDKIRNNSTSLYLGAGYRMASGKLAARYYYYDSQIKKKRFNSLSIDELPATQSSSPDKLSAPMHNVQLDYLAPKLFDLRMSYTTYHSKYQNELIEGNSTLLSENTQGIRALQASIQRKEQAWGKLQLSHGLFYTQSITEIDAQTSLDGQAIAEGTSQMALAEETAGAFAELNVQLSPTLSGGLSLHAEWYRNKERNGATLWKAWTLYPSLNVSWMPSTEHIVQASFNSNKRYPSYRFLSPTVSHVNPYLSIAGNPMLRPEKTYSSSLHYIFKSKYILTAFYNQHRDAILQQTYQSANDLKARIYLLNFDYSNYLGLNLYLPWTPSFAPTLNTSLSLTGIIKEDKFTGLADLIDAKRRGKFGLINLTLDYALPMLPALRFNFNANYQSEGAIQGLYDIGGGQIYNTSLSYSFAREKALLKLSFNDLFNGDNDTVRVDWGKQQSLSNYIKFGRSLILEFSYRYGGYKRTAPSLDRDRYKEL